MGHAQGPRGEELTASVVERLADWVVSIRYEDVPERIRELSRWQTAGVIAAMHASHDNPSARAVREAVLEWAKPGPCTAIPGGERLGLFDAVTVNSAASMALDYDDYLYMGHTGHSAVLASLAVCEAEALSTRELVLAQVIANEIGGRVGASAVLGPQNGQAWSFIHAVEGAAVGAKLWGLSREKTAHALAIALYQPTFTLWPGFMGPGSKVLTAAMPTVTGLQAARFAQKGLTGAREIFEHPRKGFWASFTWVPLPGMMAGLGSAWVSDTLAFKRYPGCAYIDTTLDALLEVMAEFRTKKGRELTPEDVRRIRVEANLLTVEMDNLSSEHIAPGEPLSPINVNFSIPFNVGIAIAAGSHEGRTLSPEFLGRNQATIQTLASKVELVHEWSHSFEVVRAFEGVLGRSGVLSELGPAQYLALVEGYRRQLGGKKKTSMRLDGLVRRLGQVAAWARRSRRSTGPTGAAAVDLGGVDFTRFRMAFPVVVRLETTSSETFSARSDVPLGAPGCPGRVEAARDKLSREFGARRGPERAAELAGAIERFEQTELRELIRLAV